MEPLAALAVELLGPNLALGAARAIEQGLAGLFLGGGGARLPEATRAALHCAAAREAADFERISRETEKVLDALAPLQPVVLKGLSLAALWPRPSLRPAGDLDLLLGEGELHTAAARLEADGYRPRPPDPGLVLRPPPTGIELSPPPGRRMPVDLHVRLFRTVAVGVAAGALLGRARPGEIRGRRVGLLDEADQLVFVLAHAAKHGARAPKWLLDGYVLARRAGDAVWRDAAQRARGFGAGRPFWAAACLIARLPGANVPEAPLRAIRPPAWTRPLISRVVRPGPPLSKWESYALEWVLERSLAARLRRLGGIVERALAKG